MDRDKLSPLYKHWLTAIARVFHNGDEDAAWEGILASEKDSIERWGKLPQQPPKKARIHIKAKKSSK